MDITSQVVEQINAAIDPLPATAMQKREAKLRATEYVDDVLARKLHTLADGPHSRSSSPIRLCVQRSEAGVTISAEYTPLGKPHATVRITDQMYVYQHRGDVHVETQTVAIPDRWQDNWPSDNTVRRYIRRLADVEGPITNLDD